MSKESTNRVHIDSSKIEEAFEGSLTEIPRLLSILRLYAERRGVGRNRLSSMELAVEEAFSNVVNHGYNKSKGIVECALSTDDKGIYVQLSDYGPPFDPTVLPAKDTRKEVSKNIPSGFGLSLLHHFADDINYTRTGDGRNQLKICFQN